MTLYHTSEEVNNLYSDNSLADSSSYTEPAPEQEDVVKMKDQNHSQTLNQETQECRYTMNAAERIQKIIHWSIQ